jgi:hypothetical protein
MSRTVATVEQELDALLALLGAESVGMGLDAISPKLGGSHQRRTFSAV